MPLGDEAREQQLLSPQARSPRSATRGAAGERPELQASEAQCSRGRPVQARVTMIVIEQIIERS